MYLLGINPVLIAAAVIPSLLLLILVFRMDRLEKEPTAMLWRLILFGILATSVAAYLERIGMQLLESQEDQPVLYTLLLTFLIIGPAEEGCKYLLLKRMTWRSPHFNCRFDAVVYAVFISLGFALWENINYVAMLGLHTAMVRAVTAVPGHASFAIFMGAWYGQAKTFERAGDRRRCKTCLRLAAIVPMLLHGLYDFIAILGGVVSLILFFVLIAVMFVTAFVVLRKLSKQDRYL